MTKEGGAHLVWDEINKAWSERELPAVRGLLSDGVYSYLQYALETDRRHGHHNMVKDARMTRSALVRVTRDAHYDAITVRLWAACKDYTIFEKSGRTYSGSRKRERTYSEYWTLIRGAGVVGKLNATRNCPNCDGDLKVNMSGNCEYCQAHVTCGEFDWVLSRIEQDEAYRG